MDATPDTAPAAAPGAGKPGKHWIAITLVAGAIGAMLAVAAGARGTYTISPWRVELSARPTVSGQSEIAVRPAPGLKPGFAQAPTHTAPMTMRFTILGVEEGGAIGDPALLSSPHDTATQLRFSEDGKEAIASFGMRLGMLALAGGAAGGAAVSFGRWRRIAGGALAGALTLGIIGLMVHQTYDVNEFQNARYSLERSDALPGGP